MGDVVYNYDPVSMALWRDDYPPIISVFWSDVAYYDGGMNESKVNTIKSPRLTSGEKSNKLLTKYFKARFS